ncbi:hypothetical protein HAP94_26265, partial [Acidithiobacillus ferrivorans]|nr:hypothetical protein [Acidithiobacillus ferrivorans]
GVSWMGVLLLLTGIYLFVWWMTRGLPVDLKYRHVCTDTLWFLGMIAVLLNVMTIFNPQGVNPAGVPKGWVGMNLHLGPITGN